MSNGDELKAGARHSASDLALIQAIHENALDLGASPRAPVAPPVAPIGVTETSEKTVDVAASGSALKALGDGRIGGYLVLYGDDKNTDLEGDYFTKATDFGKATTSPLFYHHGLDETMELKQLGEDATLKMDDVGVWMEAQLNLRDRYEKVIYGGAQKGKFGLSSGTAAHLVRRVKASNGASRVTRWPLGLDASITPTPAEPRTRAMPLKSLAAPFTFKALLEAVGDTATESERSGDDSTQPVSPNEVKNMDTPNDFATQVEEAVTKAFAARDKAAAKAAAASIGTVEIVGEVKDVKARDVDQRAFKSFGDFLLAARDAEMKNAAPEILNRLRDHQTKAFKATGMNEQVGSDGGFLLSPDVSTEIIKRTYELGAILSRVNKLPVSANANGAVYTGIDETSRANGSRYGGVVAYWASEGNQIAAAARLKLRRMEMKLNKVMGYAYITDELLQDAVAMEGLVMQAVPEEFNFKLEDGIFNGTGAGQLLGILNSPAFVSVAAEGGQTTDTVNLANITKMWARMYAKSRANAVWLLNQDVEPQIWQLTSAATSSATPVFLPPGGYSGSMYATLFGRPIIPIEYAATIGDANDIMLMDLSQYRMIDKGSINAASSIHVKFLEDETCYRFTYRVDGQPLWHSALTPFKGSNTLSPYIGLATR